MAAEHAQKQAEQRLAEAETAARQLERDENSVQRRLADQAGTIMGLQHSLQNAQADLHKFHSAHARCVVNMSYTWQQYFLMCACKQQSNSCMVHIDSTYHHLHTCIAVKQPLIIHTDVLSRETQTPQSGLVAANVAYWLACLHARCVCMVEVTGMPVINRQVSVLLVS